MRCGNLSEKWMSWKISLWSYSLTESSTPDYRKNLKLFFQEFSRIRSLHRGVDPERCQPMDYRCDDAKTYWWVGATFWCQHVGNDSRLPEMSGHCPSKTTRSLRHCKCTVTIGLSILNPNFSEVDFWRKFGLTNNSRIKSFKQLLTVLLAHGYFGNCWICKSGFLFISQHLRSWGWKSTILRWHQQSTIIASIVYGSSWKRVFNIN